MFISLSTGVLSGFHRPVGVTAHLRKKNRGMTELVLEETQPWAAFSWELPSSLKTLTIGALDPTHDLPKKPSGISVEEKNHVVTLW